MRPLLLICPALVACADPGPSGAELRRQQEEACAAVIAEHVRRPVTEITASWLSESGGIAEVRTLDGDRLHVCRVDGAGRVLGYIHPGA